MDDGRTQNEISVEHRRWRWRVTSKDGPSSPVQRLILVVLFDFYVSSPERSVFPSQKTIAERVGISQRRVKDNIDALVAGGWLRVEERTRREDGKGWRRHAYTFCWQRGFDPKADPWLKETREKRDAAREAYRVEEGWQ